jgi:hypothetical protein
MMGWKCLPKICVPTDSGLILNNLFRLPICKYLFLENRSVLNDNLYKILYLWRKKTFVDTLFVSCLKCYQKVFFLILLFSHAGLPSHWGPKIRHKPRPGQTNQGKKGQNKQQQPRHQNVAVKRKQPADVFEVNTDNKTQFSLNSKF